MKTERRKDLERLFKTANEARIRVSKIKREQKDELEKRARESMRNKMKLTKSEFTKIQNREPWESIGVLYGRSLTLTNGWGEGQVCGIWKAQGTIRVLLAWPNINNPNQLFNERIEDLVE